MHYIDLNNERRKTHDEHSFALIDGGDRPCFFNYHYCCSTSIFSHILVLCTDWTMVSAAASGVNVGIFQLIGMRIRKVVPKRIVDPMIKATKAGLKHFHKQS